MMEVLHELCNEIVIKSMGNREGHKKFIFIILCCWPVGGGFESLSAAVAETTRSHD
jgi:nitrate reductase NapE component